LTDDRRRDGTDQPESGEDETAADGEAKKATPEERRHGHGHEAELGNQRALHHCGHDAQGKPEPEKKERRR
jgi:hypothetical protein